MWYRYWFRIYGIQMSHAYFIPGNFSRQKAKKYIILEISNAFRIRKGHLHLWGRDLVPCSGFDQQYIDFTLKNKLKLQDVKETRPPVEKKIEKIHRIDRTFGYISYPG